MLSNRRRYRRGSGRFESDEVNPMENLANLVDVMLVFACALMIAIITYWNVDLSRIMDIVDREDLEKIDDINSSVEQEIDDEAFEAKGTVYEDPETGELYIVSN